ncbi:histidine kinase/DNA gyrase B/HSP90-like ATPase [Lentzea atacamensis]|uniref:histidine kinase n=1 Tax=Lentzea atacamensis TaxID=531938 RepID=A0A316I1K9_9PSEU|nr:histidine kinase/DNA gyrase B/HSP90-like ATPase [Lentzea atacamensis]
MLDVVGDARIAGPGHSWKLALPEDPVIVPGDVQRLHQVIGNLLSNARTHTPPGTTVTTGLSVHNGRVDLTVTDDGPGIPEGLEVFERFARGLLAVAGGGQHRAGAVDRGRRGRRARR